MVTGTRTRSTFMAMRAPGDIFKASVPVSAGASAPAGAPVAGAAAAGGTGTWTLLSGSSCENANWGAVARSSSEVQTRKQIQLREFFPRRPCDPKEDVV